VSESEILDKAVSEWEILERRCRSRKFRNDWSWCRSRLFCLWLRNSGSNRCTWNKPGAAISPLYISPL